MVYLEDVVIQLKLTAHMDLYSRVLSCRSTFTAEIVSEALALASFAPEILGLLQADIELSAREGKKNRLMDEIFRDEQPPLNASVIEAIRQADREGPGRERPDDLLRSPPMRIVVREFQNETDRRKSP